MSANTKRLESHRRYNRSEKGHARSRRYEESEWGMFVRYDYDSRIRPFDRRQDAHGAARRKLEAMREEAGRLGVEGIWTRTVRDHREPLANYWGERGTPERLARIAEYRATTAARQWERRGWVQDGLAYWRKDGASLKLVVAPERVRL